jgi:hypothetical protein
LATVECPVATSTVAPGTEVRMRITVSADAPAGAFTAQPDAGLYATFA